FILIALLGFYFTDVRDFDVRAAADKPKNSFDLVVLQRAGRAAAELLKDERGAENVALDALVAKELAKEEAKQLGKQPNTQPSAALERQAFAKGGSARAAVVEKYRPQIGSADLQAAMARFRDNKFFSSPAFQITMFLLLFVGFAIKVPIF